MAPTIDVKEMDPLEDANENPIDKIQSVIISLSALWLVAILCFILLKKWTAWKEVDQINDLRSIEGQTTVINEEDFNLTSIQTPNMSPPNTRIRTFREWEIDKYNQMLQINNENRLHQS
ncbi:uncharacterized protein LOC119690115 [Teleopsis dalmanni]|uniref:uncharacterized protein LOC119690115 n=1 Tax=Teleopsis dalmanni TaxID=139649 RepID=UPI0018CD210E|nr:uncharacterized protein LOC119690115 [Teleopsis dalmanni]XP_037961035.1 uncharacterized protein LOC119690115 [Teleopsis dalmanni]